MTSEVMEAVLARFNRKLVFEDRKVILFPDNVIQNLCWSVFTDQNHFLTEEYSLETTTTGCWHHPKFQGQVPKEAG